MPAVYRTFVFIIFCPGIRLCRQKYVIIIMIYTELFMILFVLLLFLAAAVSIVVIIICGTRDSSESSQDTSYSAPLSDTPDETGNPDKVRNAVENGDIPDWEDLSDRQKTALSVWSEEDGPLEDLHLFDDK
jgi:hypothetical protein